MARRVFRMIRGQQRQVRQNVWLGINLSITAAPGSSVTLLSSLNAAALALRPFTVIRTRLDLHIESDQIAATEDFHAAYGRIVVSDQAIAQGAASIPAPITNSDAPFFVWEPVLNSISFGTAVGFVEPAGRYLTVDFKAMRKVGNNEDIAGIIEVNTAPGGVISIVGRALVKLH